MTILDEEKDHQAVYDAICSALSAALTLYKHNGREETPVFREARVSAYGCSMRVSVVVEFDEP